MNRPQICHHDCLGRSCSLCDLEDYEKVHSWIQKRFDEEWTYELGIGEVVEEILLALEEGIPDGE